MLRALIGASSTLLVFLLTGCGQMLESPETESLRDALYEEQQSEIDAALAAGADPNGSDASGDPLIFEAIFAGNTEALASLLQHGADPNASYDEQSALGIAVDYHDEIAVQLLDAGARWRSDEERDLVVAAAFNAPQTLERLLEMGLDPNALDEHENHPLASACEAGQLESYRTLLAAGSSADAAYLLQAAFHSDSREMIDAVLADHPATPLPEDWFTSAALLGTAPADREWLAALVETRGAPSSEDLSNALTYVASGPHSEDIEFLMGMGATVDGTDAVTSLLSGFLMIKELRGEVEAITAFDKSLAALIAAGADVNARPEEDTPPLSAAIELMEPKLVERLLAHGADPNGVTHEHPRPALIVLIKTTGDLMDEIMDSEERLVAADSSRSKILTMLLAAGADPDLQDEEGRVALHYAGYGALVETVELLLEAGADPSVADAEGQTPAEYVQAHLPRSPSKKDKAGRLMLAVTGLDQFFAQRRESMLHIVDLLGAGATGEPIPASPAD
jgi:ankyrin repeat protein